MPNTYKLISSVTVGSGGAASMVFSSIPQTYTDLLIKVSARGVGIDNQLTFNGSTSNNSSRYLFGNGASAISGSDASNIQLQGSTESGNTANTFGNMEIYIPNYTSANYKSVSIDAVTENNATTAYAFLSAGLWSNTAAITSATITNSSGNYVQYSTAYLYGISNA
jgi:hypothetical protein